MTSINGVHGPSDGRLTNVGRKKLRNHAVRLTSDKALLYIFITSVAIVSISTLLVPLNLEESLLESSTEISGRHPRTVTKQLQKHSAATLNKGKERQQKADPSNKNTEKRPADTTNKRFQHPPRVPQSAVNIEGNSDYFKTHSSPYHVIFSSGCSTFQDWQSYVFFYHVLQSGQEGHVTRIASGCSSSEQEKTLQRIFEDEIESMKPGYHHLHLTPDFSTIPKKVPKPFKYFNKPYGVRHWMQHALGYPDNHEMHDDSVIVLIDPDQIMLRPFTRDFSNSSEYYRLQHEYGPKRIAERPHFSRKVQHGSLFSQQYGYGIQWYYKVHPEYIFHDRLPTPVSNMTAKEARDFYFAMGPPYVATAKDMWSLVTTWSDIVPRVHDEYPHLLAE